MRQPSGFVLISTDLETVSKGGNNTRKYISKY
jgi:hypothetical protein